MDLFLFDDAYLRRLRAGDRETVDHFYAYFRRLLKAKLRRMLRSPEAREDALQDVFLRVLQRLDEIKDGTRLGAFIDTTCNYVVWEQYREEGRTERLPPEWDVPAPPVDLAEKIDQELRKECVREVLATLEPRDAEILRAVLLDEEDRDAICARLDVKPSYLRVLLLRAKAKFREAWKRHRKPPGPKR